MTLSLHFILSDNLSPNLVPATSPNESFPQSVNGSTSHEVSQPKNTSHEPVLKFSKVISHRKSRNSYSKNYLPISKKKLSRGIKYDNSNKAFLTSNRKRKSNSSYRPINKKYIRSEDDNVTENSNKF